MKDKELLELAAKAAGLNVKMFEVDQDDNFSGLIVGAKNTREKIRWNPLTDDGDALRLAVRLKMCIDINWLSIGSSGDTMCFMPNNQSIMQSHGGDPYAATRRAIVRSAAEIGRSL